MHFNYDKADKFLCHCTDDVWLAEKNCEIRPKVCRDLLKYGEIDGKEYCVLHYPSQNKVEDFIKIFDERFEESDFDFRGIWFPCEVVYTQEIFEKDVDFSHATFSDNVEFMGTTFEGEANFHNVKFQGFAAFETAVFKKEAIFHNAKFFKDPSFFGITFEDEASFQNAVFQEDAHFGETKFLAGAYFHTAEFLQGCFFDSAEFTKIATFGIFHGNCNFSEAIFFDEASFDYSVFETDSVVTFRHTYFKGKANFSFAFFKGYIHFEGGEYKHYEPANSEAELIGEPRFTNVFENEAEFGFARIEKPEQITFYKTRLCPSWFVNVNVQKLIFIDINWENCDSKPGDLDAEIKRLTDRELTNPNYLLKITYRNLNDNLTSQNRVEEAEIFRKMAEQ